MVVKTKLETIEGLVMSKGSDQNKITIKTKIMAFVHIIRIPNDLAIALALIIALLFGGALDIHFPLIGYVVVAIAGFLISAHGMVINDIIDYEIDKINQPQRVLPSGQMSIKTAWIYGIFLGVLGVGLAVLIDLNGWVSIRLSWLYALFHLILLDLYNWKIKKTGFLGNVVVSYSIFALFFYSDFFLDFKFDGLPLGMGFLAFFQNLAREITKGIMDVKGDKAHGVKTIAVLFGERNAGVIAGILLILSLGTIPFFINQLSILGQIAVIVFALITLFAAYLDMTKPEYETARKVKYIILYSQLSIVLILLIDVFIRSFLRS